MKWVCNLVSIALIVASLYTVISRADSLDWYTQRVFEPTVQQLPMEQRGRVRIYDGLRDTHVHRARVEPFDWVEPMMFTGTVVTDGKGEPVREDETGALLIGNDGC